MERYAVDGRPSLPCPDAEALQGDSWNELLKEVISFDSVEEFWGIYVSAIAWALELSYRLFLQNNIAPVSELAVKSDYHLFKKGVRPEWEDPQNKHGGKWAYTSKSRTGIAIDELWLNVMLAAIGETLEDEDDSEVMGVVVNVRKGFYRIGLWTRNNGGRGGGDAKKVETLTRLGKNFKEALQLNDPETVDFTGHMDSAKAGSTRAKSAISI